VMQKSVSLKYEPVSEPLHISVKQAGFDPVRCRAKREHLQRFPPENDQSQVRYPELTGLFLFCSMIDSGLVGLGGVPREQKMLKGHPPRVIYHQVYEDSSWPGFDHFDQQ